MDKAGLYAHVRATYDTEPDYPWMTFPDYAVLRHSDTRKWYGVVMDVPRSRLGLAGEGDEVIMNVKLDRLMIAELLGNEGFLPGYHMDRRNWVSLVLRVVATEAIVSLLDISYRLTGRKK